MRKICLFITLCFALGAFAQRVTEQQALQKAQDFLKGKTFSKTNKARSVMGKSQNNPFNNFYIFNVENDEGFVIVSGDDRTKDILGYSDRGHLDYAKMPCNLKSWLSYYEEAIGAIPVGVTATRATTRSEKAAVSPLIKTLWYQSSPYNNYCPPSPEDPNVNSVTGCVATAMAQVMNYHKYPDFLPALDAYTYNDSVTVSALEGKSVDWNNDDDLLWLSRYCGQSVQMSYGKDGSYTSDGHIPAAMVKKFGYDGAEPRTAKKSLLSREGCEQYDYEITEDDFNRLGTFADDHENVELIRTAKMTYSFEDTMYGTLGPERTVWDEEAHESTKKTIKKQKESKYI